MGIRLNLGPRGIDLDLGPRGPGPRFRGCGGDGGADDWGDMFGGGRGPRGRQRRRQRQLDSSELRLLLLHLIAAEPRHGYDLIRAIEEMSGGAYAPSAGVVYPTLTMLQDMGHIEEVPGEGARKVYAATREGRAWLEEREGDADAIVDRLSDLGAGPRRADAVPIRRAVANLLAATWQQVTREEMSEKVLQEIADILDEAARRIERLRRERPDG